MVFENLMDVFGEGFASLFRKWRYRNPDNAAIIRRIQSQVGSTNSLFNGTYQRSVVGLDGDEGGFRRGQLRHLVDRWRHAVIIDLDVIENRNGSSTRTDRSQLLAEILDRLFHAFARIRNFVFGSHKCRLKND